MENFLIFFPFRAHGGAKLDQGKKLSTWEQFSLCNILECNERSFQVHLIISSAMLVLSPQAEGDRRQGDLKFIPWNFPLCNSFPKFSLKAQSGAHESLMENLFVPMHNLRNFSLRRAGKSHLIFAFDADTNFPSRKPSAKFQRPRFQ